MGEEENEIKMSDDDDDDCCDLALLLWRKKATFVVVVFCLCPPFPVRPVHPIERVEGEGNGFFPTTVAGTV